MKEIQDLSNKLDVLLKKHAALRTDKKRLERTVARQEEELAGLNEKLTEAQQQLLALQIARVLPDAAEKQRTRKQLDAVIGEIDKILTSLND